MSQGQNGQRWVPEKVVLEDAPCRVLRSHSVEPDSLGMSLGSASPEPCDTA